MLGSRIIGEILKGVLEVRAVGVLLGDNKRTSGEGGASVVGVQTEIIAEHQSHVWVCGSIRFG
jgi:hypothetical protein